MKKFLTLALLLAIWQKWDVINNAIDPPPDLAALNGGKVVLYATSWCGYCAKARKFFEDNNIAYVEYDVEKSEQGQREYQSLGGGGVPIVVIGKAVVKGYNPSKMDELLKRG